MKKIVLTLVIMLFSVITFAQNANTDATITGAFGLQLGTAAPKVKQVIQQKGGIFVEAEIKDYGVILEYSNLSFLGTSTYMTVLKFYNDTLFEIDAAFREDRDGFTQDAYNNIRDKIVNKYGNGNSIRNFTWPYEDGDGQAMIAVNNGNADIESNWIDKYNNSINLKIYSSLLIILEYQDDKIFEEAKDALNKKQQGDY